MNTQAKSFVPQAAGYIVIHDDYENNPVILGADRSSMQATQQMVELCREQPGTITATREMPATQALIDAVAAHGGNTDWRAFHVVEREKAFYGPLVACTPDEFNEAFSAERANGRAPVTVEHFCQMLATAEHLALETYRIVRIVQDDRNIFELVFGDNADLLDADTPHPLDWYSMKRSIDVLDDNGRALTANEAWELVKRDCRFNQATA